MVSFVEQRMKVALPINVVFDAPTLEALTQYLLDSAHFGIAALDDGMVLMDGDPGQGAVFAFPPATADCLGYRELAKALRPSGFYGFTFIESEDRIRRYANLIQDSAAIEPYSLFGYSSGGNLAYRVAHEIEKRGGKVASVILLDSARHLRELFMTPEQMDQIALDFLSDERASIYLTSAVLRDKAQRNIVRNLTYISNCLDTHTIAADIHLIASGDKEEVQSNDVGSVTSKAAWETATTGRFFRHQGAGRHNQMLHEPSLAENAAILRALLRHEPAMGASNLKL
jgi:hybrid polyketide synthase/nonribosomal peptide synthetase FtdB